MKLLLHALIAVAVCGFAQLFSPAAFGAPPVPAASAPTALRVCTFNIEDVRTADLTDANQPRLRALAAIIQRIKPDILFLNEIAYDAPGAPGFVEGQHAGQNGQRFADLYLAVPQGEGLSGLKFKAFMAPSNTGLSSGFDLDNDGIAITTFPQPGPTKDHGVASDQTPEGRAFGNDCFGFGTFPGQYAMALLVSDRFTIRGGEVRTFQKLAWSAMPSAKRPTLPGVKGKDPQYWYDDHEWAALRLSSKSHWDVPVEIPGGRVVHMLCSHPTPPAFDGPENRNKNRNHDEVRLWRDYLDGKEYISDDAGTKGGLAADSLFVIVGDLNADAEPGRGSSEGNPIATHIGSSPRVAMGAAPVASRDVPFLQPTDTAAFKLRVDYVVPSSALVRKASAIVREHHEIRVDEKRKRVEAWPSDHFPVWVDFEVPAKLKAAGE